MLHLRYESSGLVQSPMDQVFAHLDDHTRLSSHMSERYQRPRSVPEVSADAGRIDRCAVDNEKGIAKPPSVGFDTAPAKPAGPGYGASK